MPFATPEEVVQWLGAVQSQDYGGAKWGLAQRVGHTSSTAIDEAFARGAILRTHVMRPTWHFVRPVDIRWLLALTAPRVNAISAYYFRQTGLDDALFARSDAILARALEGGNYLTRTELAQVLEQGGITASGIRLAYIIMRAELDAVICSGPLRGKQFTYALLDERVPATKTLDHDAALAELDRRYFTSHGPALPQDFAWWSGLTVASARAGIAMAGSHLRSETIAGDTYWCVAAPPATPAMPSPTVHLLPNYDEYLIAYREYFHVQNKILAAGLKDYTNALVNHIIVLDGQVIGGWKRTLQKNAATIEARLLIPLDDAEHAALSRAADAYGRFIGLPVTLTSVSA